MNFEKNVKCKNKKTKKSTSVPLNHDSKMGTNERMQFKVSKIMWKT